VIVQIDALTYNNNCNNNKNNYLIKKFINKIGKKHPRIICHLVIHQTGVSRLKEERLTHFLQHRKNRKRKKNQRKEFIMQIGSEQQPLFWSSLSTASSTLLTQVVSIQMMCRRFNKKRMEL